MQRFIKNILVTTGKIFKSTSKNIVTTKDKKANWVTQADLQIEKYLINQISKRFPNHFILSEETYPNLPKRLPEHIWIMDPLDGTTNATFGLPIYGTSIAYMHKGEILNGAIIDLSNSDLFYGQKGKRSFKNSKELIIKDRGIKGSLVCTGCPYTRNDFEKTESYFPKIHNSGARIIIIGSAVIASIYTTTNTFSIYYEFGLKPWDIAAASLIVTGAGGQFYTEDNNQDILKSNFYICGKPTAVQEFMNLYAS